MTCAGDGMMFFGEDDLLGDSKKKRRWALEGEGTG